MSFHQRLVPTGVGSTGAEDLQASPTPNDFVSVNYQCTNAFFLTVGSTGASAFLHLIIMTLDRCPDVFNRCSVG
jgi:hypothetical protein